MPLLAELPHRHVRAMDIAEQVNLDHPTPSVHWNGFKPAK